MRRLACVRESAIMEKPVKEGKLAVAGANRMIS
jgi:hypothetical protein